MTELDNIYCATNDEYWAIQDKIIDQLIYQPVRLQYRALYYNVLYYYYHHRISLLKSDTILDTLNDLRLFTKNWIWYLKWYLNQTKIPITFEEFLDNRSLSKYTQKASKEVNYGNSNSNRNNNCKQ